MDKPRYSQHQEDDERDGERHDDQDARSWSAPWLPGSWNHTGMHAKGLAEENGGTKTPTKMLAKDLAEEDASTKTLTAVPPSTNYLTHFHEQEQESNISKCFKVPLNRYL